MVMDVNNTKRWGKNALGGGRNRRKEVNERDIHLELRYKLFFMIL